jgi:hypothetical protein
MTPQVLVDHNARPLIVFRKGRTKYHAVAARDTDIALVTLDTLRGLREATRHGDAYPPKRAASYWLNHDHREITKRARQVLRGLVARKRGVA